MCVDLFIIAGGLPHPKGMVAELLPEVYKPLPRLLL